MEILRQVFSVVLVFGLLGGGLWTLRRGGRLSLRGPARKNRSLESIERLALTPQHCLHLVRIGEREVLIATHPHGCAALAEAGGGK